MKQTLHSEGDMPARLKKAILALVCGVVLGTSAGAGPAGGKRCSPVEPTQLAAGQPFLLNDPRTGLTLYVESDGRHMAAITRTGKILWHRNLFDDPKLARLFPPPPDMPGEPSVSLEHWDRQMRAYVAELSIDRIGFAQDCELSSYDPRLRARFRGHNIRAGSGTHIFWLLDATTGDLQMEAIN